MSESHPALKYYSFRVVENFDGEISVFFPQYQNTDGSDGSLWRPVLADNSRAWKVLSLEKARLVIEDEKSRLIRNYEKAQKVYSVIHHIK
jgi:hypothetical protein